MPREMDTNRAKRGNPIRSQHYGGNDPTETYHVAGQGHRAYPSWMQKYPRFQHLEVRLVRCLRLRAQQLETALPDEKTPSSLGNPALEGLIPPRTDGTRSQ
mgnify:FL=1